MTKFSKTDNAIFDAILVECRAIGLADIVAFDVDHFPSESNYCIRTRFSAFACIRKIGEKSDYCVEYFGHNDGEIYTLVCPDLATTLRSLKFVTEMLSCIRVRLDNLL